MSVDENKALMTRYYECATARDLDAAKGFYSPDATLVYNTPPGEVPAQELFKRFMIQIGQAFPDYQYRIEDIFGEGDRVAVRYSFTGTHQGELRGFAPTGKVVKAEGIAIYRIVNGKIVESRRQTNSTEVLIRLRGSAAASR